MKVWVEITECPPYTKLRLKEDGQTYCVIPDLIGNPCLIREMDPRLREDDNAHLLNATWY